MIVSTQSKHVFYAPPGLQWHTRDLEGGWYFTDETEDIGGGPYRTEHEALSALNRYAAELNDLRYAQ